MNFLNLFQPGGVRRRVCGCIVTLAALWCAPAAADSPPRVVASILPVHSLAAAVMDGVGAPQLVLPASQSPHILQLKPSQRRMLAEAELILWVGDGLETALGKTIARLDGNSRVVELMRRKEIKLLPFRDTDLHMDDAHDSHSKHAKHDDHDDHDDHSSHADHDDHDAHDGHNEHDSHGEHDDHDAHDSHAGHNHGAHDVHIWLSFANARAMVNIIAAELSELDPRNRAAYYANARQFNARLATRQSEMRARLQPLRDAPYAVLHDAYQYFERQFELRAPLALRARADQPPGAKRLREVRQRIAADDIRCVFSEPQFNARWLHAFDDMQIAAATLDPLGANLQPGADAWFRLVENIAAAMEGCLTR